MVDANSVQDLSSDTTQSLLPVAVRNKDGKQFNLMKHNAHSTQAFTRKTWKKYLVSSGTASWGNTFSFYINDKQPAMLEEIFLCMTAGAASTDYFVPSPMFIAQVEILSGSQVIDRVYGRDLLNYLRLTESDTQYENTHVANTGHHRLSDISAGARTVRIPIKCVLSNSGLFTRALEERLEVRVTLEANAVVTSVAYASVVSAVSLDVQYLQINNSEVKALEQLYRKNPIHFKSLHQESIALPTYTDNSLSAEHQLTSLKGNFAMVWVQLIGATYTAGTYAGRKEIWGYSTDQFAYTNFEFLDSDGKNMSYDRQVTPSECRDYSRAVFGPYENKFLSSLSGDDNGNCMVLNFSLDPVQALKTGGNFGSKTFNGSERVKWVTADLGEDSIPLVTGFKQIVLEIKDGILTKIQ